MAEIPLKIEMIFLGCSNEQTSKIFINEGVTMKFYHQLL